MSFTEQDALAIAKQFAGSNYAYGDGNADADAEVKALFNHLMAAYNDGIEQGKSYDVKRAFWDGVKVGVERYSYLHYNNYEDYCFDKSQGFCVGPNGTTKLKDALDSVEREAQEALKS